MIKSVFGALLLACAVYGTPAVASPVNHEGISVEHVSPLAQAPPLFSASYDATTGIARKTNDSNTVALAMSATLDPSPGNAQVNDNGTGRAFAGPTKAKPYACEISFRRWQTGERRGSAQMHAAPALPAPYC